MKNLVKYLSVLFVICTMSSAFAETIQLDGSVTDDQRRLIDLEIAKIRATTPTALSVQPEEVKKWAAAFEGIGEGLVKTAKALGIEANAFAKSPLGIVTISLVVWSYAGQDLVQIIFGFIWLMIGVPTWVYMYRRIGVESNATYEKDKGPDGARHVIKYFKDKDFSDAKMVHAFFLVGILAIGVLSVIV